MALRPGLPRFCGGLAGYFGYDAVRYIEPKLASDAQDRRHRHARHPAAAVRGAGGHRQPVGAAVPDRLCRPGRSPRPTSTAKRRLSELGDKLHYSVTAPAVKRGPSYAVEREFAKADYLAAVLKAKEYIAAGDMMQVQVGQRLRKRYTESPLSLYRALRSLNPSPVHVLLRHGRLPDRRRVARDPGAPRAHARRRQDHDPSAGRHAPARRHARAGQGARGRAAGRPEGARRAPDADRPGAQRHRPHRQDRQRQGDRGLRRRALLARDAHRQQRRGPAASTA